MQQKEATQFIELKDEKIIEDDLIDRLRQEKELREGALVLKKKMKTQKKEFEEINQKIVNQYIRKNVEMRLAYDFDGQYILGKPMIKRTQVNAKLIPTLQVKVLPQEVRVQKIPINPPPQPALVIHENLFKNRKKDKKKKQETLVPLIHIVDKSKDGIRSLLREKFTIESEFKNQISALKIGEQMRQDSSRKQISELSIDQSNNLLKKITNSPTYSSNRDNNRPQSSSPNQNNVQQQIRGSDIQLKRPRRPDSSRKGHIAALPDAAKILCEKIELQKPLRRFSEVQGQLIVKKAANQIVINNNALFCQLFDEV